MPAESARADAGSGTRAPAPHQSMSCLPDVGAQITFDVDSTRAMRQRQKGKNKALAGTWSIRGRDLVEVVLQTCKGTSPVVEGPRGTDVIHGEYVDVPSKLQKRHGMVSARAALLLDARRELVLVLRADATRAAQRFARRLALHHRRDTVTRRLEHRDEERQVAGRYP